MTISRRRFVQGSAVAAGAMTLGSSRRVLGANDTLRVAVLGVRGRGQTHVDWVMDTKDRFDENIDLVALCDPDAEVLAARKAKYDSKYKLNLETEKDFRKIIERDDIDIVCIASPNHWHSLQAIMAMQAGKDVYCEKPVSHNVWEGRQLVNAARRFEKVCQTGTQSRSAYGLHSAAKFLRKGELGEIKYAVGTCYKPRKPIGKLDKPLQIPDSIDYDLWCGPAQKVDLYRPGLHYDWHWDFNTGNGDLGNQGIHQMDIARWMCGHNTVSPKVMSIGTRALYDDASNTPHSELTFHMYDEKPIIFDTRGMPSEAKYREQEGRLWQDKMDNLLGARIGVVVFCEGGHLVIGSYSSGTAYDNDGNKVKSFNGGGEHMANFFKCVRDRTPDKLFAEIEQGHLSSALCHTGNISYQLGKPAKPGEMAEAVKGNHGFSEALGRFTDHLGANEVDLSGDVVKMGPWLEMDTKTERFTNNDQANALLTREYRAPYVVPDLSGAV